ncbi:MAG: phosphoribosylglycinamide formyltransferase-1 [Gammaproteobacteria bacterium]|jgi:phosphoribosylglycinamide formyltransferase-1
MTSTSLRVAVLVSGRGSNLQALIDACSAQEIDARIVAVICNVPTAVAVSRAASANIDTAVVDHKAFGARTAFDRALRQCIDGFEPELIVLAGFMRVLSAEFVNTYRGCLINIHPSLLPAYRGLDTHRRVLEAGDHEHGATVHFVTAQLDGGPLIAQARVLVLADDDEQALASRVLAEEHRLLPWVVGLFAKKRVSLNDNDQVSVDGTAISGPLPLS